MPDYNNSKIYKIEPIVPYEEGDIYIGSTTSKYLAQRLRGHRSNYRKYKEGKFHRITVFKLFDKYGMDNCKIVLLENVVANNIDELLEKEGQYMRNLNCVNRCSAGRSRNEYAMTNKEYFSNCNKIKYIENREQILEQVKKYASENKEKIREYQKQYREEKVKCECGSIISRAKITDHNRTLKHKGFLNSQEL